MTGESTAETKFLGPITTEEARVLFMVPVDEEKVDISTEEGQKAVEILNRIGATGARDEVAVVVDAVEHQEHLEPTELRVLSSDDLGTLILQGANSSYGKHIPSPREALELIQLP